MTSKRFAELRLILPVIAAWCLVLFGVVKLVELRFDGFPYHGIPFFVPLVYGWLAVGIWMTLLWMCLYGRGILRWVVAPLMPTCFAVGFTWLVIEESPYRYRLALAVCIVSVLSLVPLAVARRRSNWRILKEDAAEEVNVKPYSLKRVFLLTGMIALLLALARLVNLPTTEVVLPWVAIAILPAGFAMILPAVMSRISICYVWVATPFLVTAFSVTAAWCLESGFRPHERVSLLYSTLPMLAAYAGFACFLLLAATYLRFRGVVLQFGGGNGFAIPRAQPGEFSTRKFVMVSAALVGVIVLIGGYFYHAHWVLNKWPIPTEPSPRHVSRLIVIATDNRTASGPNRMNVDTRRNEARRAIASMGPEIVPVLLPKLRPIDWNDDDSTRVTLCVLRILTDLAQNKGLGPHNQAVIDAIKNEPSLYSDGSSMRTNDHRVITQRYLFAVIGRDAVPALIEVLGSSDPRLVNAAANSLSQMDPKVAAPALPALKQACLNDDWQSNSAAPFFALVKLLGNEAMPILLEVLGDPSTPTGVHVAAVGSMVLLGPDAAVALPAILSLLSKLEDDAKASMPHTDRHRARVIRTVGAIGPAAAPTATAPLLKLLEQQDGMFTSTDAAGYARYRTPDDSPLWNEILVVLGQIKSEEAVPHLMELLENEHATTPTKRHIVDALAAIGPPAAEATPLLKSLAQLQPSRVDEAELASAAMVAMTRINLHSANLAPSILRRLGRVSHEIETEEDQETIHYAFNGYGNPERELTEADQRRYLLRGLLTSLAWVGGQDDPTLMKSQTWGNVSRMHENMVSSSRQMRAISESFKGIPDREQTDWTRAGCVLAIHNALAEGLETKEPKIQRTAVDVMMAISQVPPSVFEMLRPHLNSSDPELRVRVAAFLIAFGEPNRMLYDQALEVLSEAVSENEDLPPHVRAVHREAVILE